MRIDEIDLPAGYAEVKRPGCKGCEFSDATGDRCDCPSYFPRCDSYARGYSLIFVKKPSSATAAWPYDSEGTPVEVTQ